MVIDDLNLAVNTWNQYQQASAEYFMLVAQGSPQPQTNNAQAIASAARTAWKNTQAAIDADYAAT